MRAAVSTFLTAVVMLAVPFAASAHHSFAAIWDESKSMTVTGTLAKVDWINPHSYFYVDVKDEQGKVARYAFEGFPPQMLRNFGVEKKLLASRLGQQVKVLAYPAKDGTKTLGFGRAFAFEDGHTVVMVRDPGDLGK